ncbi:hypothetical protein [Mycobacterium sp. HUMS_1102779]|uniref:hypothetical protein n=1 Tax=Mycobacterium sp. HUMS_1102779 TaxID=3383487 RepID=UPI003899DB83
MARDCAGSERTPEYVCPPQCRLRLGAARDTTREQVDWAGLPVNLDFVFSQNQRDRVYVQHLLRPRDPRLARRFGDSPRLCARGNDCPLAREDALARTPPAGGR